MERSVPRRSVVWPASLMRVSIGIREVVPVVRYNEVHCHALDHSSVGIYDPVTARYPDSEQIGRAGVLRD